jgi:DNA-binding transcriptional LysR family regulator
MNLKQLEYFAAVVEAGNISSAAKKLHVSQPPLSTQMKLLEEELGVKLMERGARNIKLTEAGKTLYKRAVSVADMINAAKKEVCDLGRGLQGTLTLGTISSSGAALLGEKMQNFYKIYPDVHFEVYEGNTYQLLERLDEGSIEVAVVRTPFNEEGFSCIYLNEEPMVAVGKKGFFKNTEREEISVKDLDGRPLIYYRRFENLITHVFEEEGIIPRVCCKNDDARTSLMWARAGMGIALVPKGISAVFSDPDMTYKVLEEEKMYTRLAVIHKKGEYLSNIAKGFLKVFYEQP